MLLPEILQIKKMQKKKLSRLSEELRQLSIHLININDKERSEVAIEIHDKLAQNLAALSMNLGRLKGTLQNLNNVQEKIINDQLKIANDLMSDSINLFYSLYPSLLDEIGLISAIEWHANNLLKTSDIKFTIQSNIGEVKLSKEIRLNLFRIFQECFTNSLLYSRASDI
eukprot:Opistho-1_new@105100